MQIDLDDPDFAADNEATVRTFWSGRPRRSDWTCVVDEAVARAGATCARSDAAQASDAIAEGAASGPGDPRGLAALLAQLWQAGAIDPIAVMGSGPCARRAGRSRSTSWRGRGWAVYAAAGFVHGTRELLVETRRANGGPEYRCTTTRSARTSPVAIVATVLREHHDAWRDGSRRARPRGGDGERYALRQRCYIGRRPVLGRRVAYAADTSFLEAKCRSWARRSRGGCGACGERCRASVMRRSADASMTWLGAWARIALAAMAPEATAALVWNRLRQSGWSADEIDHTTGSSRGDFLRARLWPRARARRWCGISSVIAAQ